MPGSIEAYVQSKRGGLLDDVLHSPNEKYRLENYYTGIVTIARFFGKCGVA